MDHSRAEVEARFRDYYMTGPVNEDWATFSRFFTEDAIYTDHTYGIFHGPAEIAQYLERGMSSAPQLYAALVWYVIDGDRVVYNTINRADNPQQGEPPFEFPSLQVATYAGDGKWSSEEDWWVPADMAAFFKGYERARVEFDPDHPAKLSRQDFGPWVDWARPAPGHRPAPSWLGKSLATVRSASDVRTPPS
jgi:hypothetical protein